MWAKNLWIRRKEGVLIEFIKIIKELKSISYHVSSYLKLNKEVIDGLDAFIIYEYPLPSTFEKVSGKEEKGHGKRVKVCIILMKCVDTAHWLLLYLCYCWFFFYDGPLYMQLWALQTRRQCRVSDTHVTVKAHGPLVLLI